MLGNDSRSCCRKWFKKLELLPIPSSYIYSLMLFVVHNLHYFQLTPLFMRLIQDIRIIYIYLHLDLLLYREVLNYSAIKIFNQLPPRTSGFKMIRQFSSLI